MRPLIFIPGFKGSRLVTPGGRCEWLTGAVALGLRTPALDLRGRQDLVPAGPLERVTVIPRLLEEQIYAPWLDVLRRSGRPWRAFAYDWRRDNTETAERFADHIGRVRDELGSPVDIVAHSMGGLITLAALHAGVEGVARVFFAGVPFCGGIGFLDDLHAGTSTGLNRRVLAPEVVATFPSVFSFFPLHGARLLDTTGNRVEIDLYEAADWKRYTLGPYRSGRSAPDFDAYFRTILAQAKRFRERLEAPMAAYPEFRVLVGAGRPTLAAVRQHEGRRGITWNVRGGDRGDGDGRVCAAHAVPPEGIPFTRLTSSLAHSRLLVDPSLQAWL